jgi:hypothetical protein
VAAFGKVRGEGGLSLSGLDLIATLVISAPFWAGFSVVGWMLSRGISEQRSWKLNAAITTFVVLASALATYWVYRNNAGSPSAEYPALVDAYELADPQSQVAMAAVLMKARSRREIFSMSLAQRDRFLDAGGYCLHASQSACKKLPRGTLIEGDAVEALGSMPLKQNLAGVAKP